MEDSGNLKITVDTFSGQPGFTNFLPKNGWIEVSPRAVAVGSDGSVYISEACRILHFDTMWNLMDEWGSCGTDNGQFNGATGLAVGADGSVYVADSGNHAFKDLLLVARSCKHGEFGASVTANSFGQRPSLLLLTALCTSQTRTITGSRGLLLMELSWQNGDFLGWQWDVQHSSDIATGPDGSVYVADSGNHRVQRFAPEGAYLNKWGSEGSGDGQFFYP